MRHSWRWLQIEFDGISALTSPAVIAAFEGWNDAGEAASAAVSHLSTVWDATAIGEIDPEDYYDFQVTRPVLEVTDGQTRRLAWPTTRLAHARPAGLDRDIILVHGIEPNMRWRGFCRELVDGFTELGAELVILVGALLADSPHTRPVPVTVAASDEKLASALQIEPVDYQGPTGIVGVLQDACTASGIPAVSLWAAVPHYVAQPPSPKATLSLLRGVEDILDAPMPLGDLPDEAQGLGARRRRARRAGLRGRRVRAGARGGQGRHRPARGQRRCDRPRVRALPAPPRRARRARRQPLMQRAGRLDRRRC